MNPAARRQSTRSYIPNTGPSSRDRVPYPRPDRVPAADHVPLPEHPPGQNQGRPAGQSGPLHHHQLRPELPHPYEEPPEHPDLMGTIERQ